MDTTLRSLPVGDGLIDYCDSGTGEPLLLIHAGCLADWFLPLAGDPQPSGLRVIRPIRVGYRTPERGTALAEAAAPPPL